MVVRRLLAAGLCLPLLVLSSCSGDDPAQSPKGPRDGPSSVTVETDTGIPTQAMAGSEAGARAFIHHYFRVLSEAMNDGDVTSISRLSAVDCVSCTAIRRNIAKSFAEGGTVDSEGWKTTRLRRTHGSRMVFDLVGFMGEETFYDADRQVVRHFEGSNARMRIRLVRGRSGWLVKRLEISR